MIQTYSISDEALQLIISESAYHFPNEAGGILVGKIKHSHVFIHHATQAGPNARHEPTKFKRDGNYSQEILDTLVKNSGGRIDYIGEWHSHPFKSKPSLTDINSMKWITINRKYMVKEPIMFLCEGTGHNSWEIHCYTIIDNILVYLKSITKYSG